MLAPKAYAHAKTNAQTHRHTDTHACKIQHSPRYPARTVSACACTRHTRTTTQAANLELGESVPRKCFAQQQERPGQSKACDHDDVEAVSALHITLHDLVKMRHAHGIGDLVIRAKLIYENGKSTYGRYVHRGSNKINRNRLLDTGCHI